MRRRALFALPLLAAPALARAQPAPLAVVASFTILADMARQVGGDRVAVTFIVGPDMDSHIFQARPSHAEALRNAGLVLCNGIGFEPWLDRLLGAASPRGQVVTVTQGITPRTLAGGHEHGGRQPRAAGPRVPDPHAWQDLRLAATYLGNIEAGLIAADPAGAETYRARAADYRGRLAALDSWVRDQVGSVPEGRRKVITNHDAFGYFGDAYGVTFLAPQGLSTHGEPSAADIGGLIRQMRAERITAVFLENATNPAIIERLAREAGARVQGRLYADALSPEGGPAPSYEALFRHNLGLLVPAMRGNG
ncbi:MAG TPA: metal ABC transporter substrate-binding protein [Roseomonas sp.]|jgi:zinc/manganese transport system substrate-binding protein